jgi:hypothetical protein
MLKVTLFKYRVSLNFCENLIQIHPEDGRREEWMLTRNFQGVK